MSYLSHIYYFSYTRTCLTLCTWCTWCTWCTLLTFCSMSMILCSYVLRTLHHSHLLCNCVHFLSSAPRTHLSYTCVQLYAVVLSVVHSYLSYTSYSCAPHHTVLCNLIDLCSCSSCSVCYWSCLLSRVWQLLSVTDHVYFLECLVVVVCYFLEMYTLQVSTF